jgi:endonuclease-3
MLGHGIPSIAIDVHCERIPKRLGLVPEWAGVEEVKKRLESLVPKEKWHVVNRGFVLFGRDLCKPIKPKCEECTLKSLCRHAKELFK